MAGIISNDRRLGAEVRRLTLNKIKAILEKPAVEMNAKDKELHDAILLKLAGNVLPKLTEITGDEGTPIQINFDPAFRPNAVTRPTEEGDTESGEV